MNQSVVPDPLAERYRNEAETLKRRRERTAEASKDTSARRVAFFERLALLNAGALTFSVTLRGNLGAEHTRWPLLLHSAWGLLLIALGSCLVRNFAHQHHELSDAMAKMAGSEVACIDADSEIITNRFVVYSDSPEPFDRQREISLNRSKRERWQGCLTEEQAKETLFWRLVVVSEWAAGISMFAGFLLLVAYGAWNS